MPKVWLHCCESWFQLYPALRSNTRNPIERDKWYRRCRWWCLACSRSGQNWVKPSPFLWMVRKNHSRLARWDEPNGQGHAFSVKVLSVHVPTIWAPRGETQYKFVAQRPPDEQHELTWRQSDSPKESSLCKVILLTFELGSQGKSSDWVPSTSKQLLNWAWERIANQRSRKTRAPMPEITVQTKLIKLRSRRNLPEKKYRTRNVRTLQNEAIRRRDMSWEVFVDQPLRPKRSLKQAREGRLRYQGSYQNWSLHNCLFMRSVAVKISGDSISRIDSDNWFLRWFYTLRLASTIPRCGVYSSRPELTDIFWAGSHQRMSVSIGRYEYSFILLCLRFKCCAVFRRRYAMVSMRERWTPLQSCLEKGWQAASPTKSIAIALIVILGHPELSHQHLWHISPWHWQLRTTSRMMLILTMITESTYVPWSTEFNIFVGSVFLCILKSSQRVWRRMAEFPVL